MTTTRRAFYNLVRDRLKAENPDASFSARQARAAFAWITDDADLTTSSASAEALETAVSRAVTAQLDAHRALLRGRDNSGAVYSPQMHKRLGYTIPTED